MQLVRDVNWGELDYLVLDLPPGTGDVALTLSQSVRAAGAVLVTTPQDVALADVVRAKQMFDKVHIPVLGIVENMSQFVCPHCQRRRPSSTTAAAARPRRCSASRSSARFPLELKVREAATTGRPGGGGAPGQPGGRRRSWRWPATSPAGCRTENMRRAAAGGRQSAAASQSGDAPDRPTARRPARTTMDAPARRHAAASSPEFVRKVAVAGLGALFMTEEGIR